MSAKFFVVLSVLAGAALSHAANEPDQLRLAFVPDGMTVSWTTPSSLSGSPQVRYGFSPSSLSQSAEGVSHSYGTSYFHDVILSDLASMTQYFYQVVADPNSSESAILNFTSGRTAGDATPFKMMLVGDMGLKNSANTMASLRIEQNNYDFVMHIGDISYADDYYLRPGDTYENSWTKWQDEMESVTQSKAYMTLPGNHEVTCSEATPFLCPEGQRNMTAYRHRFRMPGPESSGYGNLWFSYDYGMAHLVHVNMETDFDGAPSGEGTWLNGGGEEGQLEWLEDDLKAAAANRKNVPWIIVAGHRPLYSSGGACKSCVKAFESLFNKYGIDIYFAGHVHWYERCYAIAPGGKVQNKNYVNPIAPVYIINGAAGNVEGHTGGSAKQAYTAFLNNKDYGYGILSFHNSSSLNWAYYRATDQSLVDEVAITKFH